MHANPFHDSSDPRPFPDFEQKTIAGIGRIPWDQSPVTTLNLAFTIKGEGSFKTLDEADCRDEAGDLAFKKRQSDAYRHSSCPGLPCQ
jgi:hypothetical protein